jgi:hypothetical protein
MLLQEEIDQRRQEIRTDSYSMSIGEWISLYENHELDIHDDQEQVKHPIALQKTTYLPSLEGKKWHDPEDPENSLNQTQRLLIKRAKIAVNIIEKESDEMIKYELFQRLNTGGSIARPQEVRNCILLMLNKKLYELMR